MSKFKNKKADEIKIKGGAKHSEKACEQFPAISFRHLTNNKNHNLEYFKKDKVKLEDASIDLSKKMVEICNSPWLELYNQSKRRGIETLYYADINANLAGDFRLTPDEKLLVFRFGGRDFRMVGFRKGNCPTLFVVAFDFDFSLYNHG